MIAILFGSIFAMALLMVHTRAHKNGFVQGMKIGLAVFRTKIPLETYKSICQSRVAELDALNGVKR